MEDWTGGPGYYSGVDGPMSQMAFKGKLVLFFSKRNGCDGHC